MCIFNGTLNTCTDGSVSFEYSCVGWNCYKAALFPGANCTYDQNRTNVYCSTDRKCDGKAKFTSAFKLSLDDQDIYISRGATYSFDTGHYYNLGIDERTNTTSSNITDLPLSLSSDDSFDPTKVVFENGTSTTSTVATSSTSNPSSTQTHTSSAPSYRRPTLSCLFWIAMLAISVLFNGASASVVESNSHNNLRRNPPDSVLNPSLDQALNTKRSDPQWYTLLQDIQSTILQIAVDQNELALPATNNCTARSGPPLAWYTSLTTLAIDATCEMLVDDTRTDPIAALPSSAQYPALASLLVGNCLRKTTAKVLSLVKDRQYRNQTSIATRFNLAFVAEYLCDRIGSELADNPDSYKRSLCTVPFDQRPKWGSESDSSIQTDPGKIPAPLKSIYEQEFLCEWSMEAVAANFTEPIPGTNVTWFY